jgi:general stress protein YciG
MNKEKIIKQFLSENGKKGGLIGGAKTAEKGFDYYSSIGKKGAEAKRVKRGLTSKAGLL